ncbi:MAG: nucleotidyltransferase family protein [Acidimicrobiales bacterium]
MTSNASGPQLVIMAAGLGSRFGGVKQLARVGSGGEAFLDFSINDAIAAGFGEIVLIVRTEIEADVREHMVRQHPDLEIVYVCQDHLGPPRDKPWGTTHAVLSAARAINAPFSVINADDYYGKHTFELAFEELTSSAPGRAANVAFEMGKTVPPRGAVTRAVVQIDAEVFTGLVETEGCERLVDGSLVAGDQVVSEDTPVSMNFWCFDPSVLGQFQDQWDQFLDTNRNDPKAEAQLPTMVNDLINNNELTVAVVRSPEKWIGITNPEDLELAIAELASR